jgi:hypothetical protein
LPILVPLIRRLSSVAVDYVPSRALTGYLSLSSLMACLINFFDEFFLTKIALGFVCESAFLAVYGNILDNLIGCVLS